MDKKLYLAELLGTCATYLYHAHTLLNDDTYAELAEFASNAQTILEKEIKTMDKEKSVRTYN